MWVKGYIWKFLSCSLWNFQDLLMWMIYWQNILNIGPRRACEFFYLQFCRWFKCLCSVFPPHIRHLLKYAWTLFKSLDLIWWWRYSFWWRNGLVKKLLINHAYYSFTFYCGLLMKYKTVKTKADARYQLILMREAAVPTILSFIVLEF